MISTHGSPARSRLVRIVMSVALAAAAGLPGSGCSKKSAGSGGFSMPPMPVEVALVTRRPIAEHFEVVGTVEAGDAATIVAEIPGIVERLPFREGDSISKGALIAQLDDDQYVAERDRADALRAQAQSTYERIKEVVAQRAGAPQDLDDASAALKVAEANLAVAKARLAKSRITAPFGGIVGSRRVSPGSYVTPGETIVELAQIAELRINFSAPERYLAKLTRGAPVTVSVTAYPGYSLQGQIDVIDPVLDEATRSARLVARVRNLENKFRPGMSANVSAVLSERQEALTIPSEAVFVDGTQPFVFVVNPDSSVTRAPLVLGTRLADVVEVVQGLSADQMVVRAGHQKLFEGARVIPVSAGAGGPGAPGDPSAPGTPDASSEGAAPAAAADPAAEAAPPDSARGGER